jgi:hypothetical protein
LSWRLPVAGALSLLAALGIAQHQAHAGGLHHAALVIEHGSGRLITRCVSFLEDQITGLQLIQRAGVEYQTQQFGGLGSAVCQLDGEPQPVPANCLGTGAYWQYFHRTAAGWVPSGGGASSATLRDGDADGWHYATGAGQLPAAVSFASVCGPAPQVAATTTASHAAPAPPRSATTTPHAAPPASTASSATNLPSPQALASAPPTAASPALALAHTGPSPPSTTKPASSPLMPWLVAGGSAFVLLAIAAVNLWRRS